MGKRYVVEASVTVSIYTIVDGAKSPEDAIRKVKDRPLMGMSGNNSGYEPDEFWMCDELDGEPKEFTVEIQEEEE